MTPAEFMIELSDYWSKLTKNEAISCEILKEVQTASSAALLATLRQMKSTIRPNYTIGVADVLEAARISGSVLHTREFRSFSVSCPSCQGKYSYQQGLRDVCPYCGFDYYDYVVLKQYEQLGRPWHGYVSRYRSVYYDKKIRDAERRVEI